ncbi:hypothetical protein HPP92_020344 [Vanilla planifolia]|uniref:Uncharacterized protein n=1 Tax=Vanilla planifolia TaxID=51239 RepID=A0A835UKP8_VANPL|nr:hypothetical protein HPP92_020344 [Vanilla planifolia]
MLGHVGHGWCDKEGEVQAGYVRKEERGPATRTPWRAGCPHGRHSADTPHATRLRSAQPCNIPARCKCLR